MAAPGSRPTQLTRPVRAGSLDGLKCREGTGLLRRRRHHQGKHGHHGRRTYHKASASPAKPRAPTIDQSAGLHPNPGNNLMNRQRAAHANPQRSADMNPLEDTEPAQFYRRSNALSTNQYAHLQVVWAPESAMHRRSTGNFRQSHHGTLTNRPRQ